MAVTIRCKLKDILKQRGLTQYQLHQMTGVRQAYISEIANDARTTLNKENLAKIMVALNITDMNEILELVNVEETPRR